MKLMVQDPERIARQTGGCTYEPGRGWWTFSERPLPGAEAIRMNGVARLFVPTQTRHGRECVHGLRSAAAQMMDQFVKSAV